MPETGTRTQKLGRKLQSYAFLGFAASGFSCAYQRYLVHTSPHAYDSMHSLDFSQHGIPYFITPAQGEIYWGLLGGGAIIGITLFIVGFCLASGEKFYWSESARLKDK
jgi:hypothetical protein